MSNGRVLSVGIACSLALLAGCRTPTATEALSTRVTLDRASLKPGDTLKITVTVTNTGPFEVTVRGSSSCFIGAEVYRESTGDLVYPGVGQLCTADLHPFRFESGQSRVRTLSWTAEPPGRYRVVGNLGSVRLGRPSSPALVDVVLP